jgi:DNA-binding transcriptional MerR regulator
LRRPLVGEIGGPLKHSAQNAHWEPRSRSADRDVQEIAGASDRPTYNTAAVELRTGLRPATFRAWERRYGFPKPRRLPGNQRLYSEQDIASIRWLHRRTGEGLAISQAVALLRDSLSSAVPAVEPAVGRAPTMLAADLERALVAFDSVAADAVLSEGFTLYPIERVCQEIVEPTLVSIGERWHGGELGVATEHFATTLVRRKLFALLDLYETGRGRGSIFTACAPDEWHEVGILVVSLFLVRRGFRVFCLGPNLSADGLDDTLRQHRPDLLCISATTDETAERIREVDQVISSLDRPRPTLAFGGAAFADQDRQRRTPGTYLGPSADSAVETVERLLNSQPG